MTTIYVGLEDLCDQSALYFWKLDLYFPFLNVLLVEREACSHVGLEDLCDRVYVGCCPDVQAQIHPDIDDGDDDCDDVEDELSVCL